MICWLSSSRLTHPGGGGPGSPVSSLGSLISGTRREYACRRDARISASSAQRWTSGGWGLGSGTSSQKQLSPPQARCPPTRGKLKGRSSSLRCGRSTLTPGPRRLLNQQPLPKLRFDAPPNRTPPPRNTHLTSRSTPLPAPRSLCEESPAVRRPNRAPSATAASRRFAGLAFRSHEAHRCGDRRGARGGWLLRRHADGLVQKLEGPGPGRPTT
jgi:hypothetical protein